MDFRTERGKGLWALYLSLGIGALLGGSGCSHQARPGDPVTVPTTMIPDGPAPAGAPGARSAGEGMTSVAPLAVFFDFDQARLREDAREALKQHGRRLVDEQTSAWSIEGHCDERGTVEYNLALGERRARAVRDFLVAYGVDGSRFETISFGEERPMDLGHGESAWTQNRRADLRSR